MKLFSNIIFRWPVKFVLVLPIALAWLCILTIIETVEYLWSTGRDGYCAVPFWAARNFWSEFMDW